MIASAYDGASESQGGPGMGPRHETEPASWEVDPLREAKGCFNGFLLVACIWLALGLTVWWLSRG